MAKEAPPKIRLGGPGMPGAEVYNYYQLISILSGLYVKALDRRDEEALAGAWEACSMSILEQVGAAHSCWTRLQASAASGLAPENLKLIKRTLTLVHRLTTIDENLTEWTGVARWARVMLAVEKQLKKLGCDVVRQNPYLKENIDGMNSSIDGRCALLTEVRSKAIQEEQSLTQNYAEPIAL